MGRHVALVRTYVSEERISSIIRLKTTLAVTNGGDTFLRNIGCYKRRTASQPRRRHSFRFQFGRISQTAVHITNIRNLEAFSVNDLLYLAVI
jgi:hypothetical protein